MENILPNYTEKSLETEPLLEVTPPSSIDGFHDLLTHFYSLPIFYDSLRRELSFAKRENLAIALLKFELPSETNLDQLLFFANELDKNVRQHDFIARLSRYEFVVLLRFDKEINEACESLVHRMKNVEKRRFAYAWIVSNGTKSLEEILKEIENPQILNQANLR